MFINSMNFHPIVLDMISRKAIRLSWYIEYYGRVICILPFLSCDSAKWECCRSLSEGELESKLSFSSIIHIIIPAMNMMKSNGLRISPCFIPIKHFTSFTMPPTSNFTTISWCRAFDSLISLCGTPNFSRGSHNKPSQGPLPDPEREFTPLHLYRL